MQKILKYISNINEKNSDIEEYRKHILFGLLFLVFALYLLIMAVISFMQKDIILGIVDLSLVVVLTPLAYLVNKRHKEEMFTQIVIVIAGVFYFICL